MQTQAAPFHDFFIWVTVLMSYSFVVLTLSFLKWRDISSKLYSMAFLIYTCSLLAGTQLNPRDRVGASWTDPCLQALTIASFVACIISPIFSRLPWPTRVAYCGLCFMTTIVPFWFWYSVTG